MKRTTKFFAALLLSSALGAGEAQAWEASTTHAGLTEQSALTSTLHLRLREHFGAERGLYSTLGVPEADAPGLFDVLRRLNPTHGYVPDKRGRMSALSWLVAGSVVADVPAADARNHFFDPRSQKGLSDSAAGGVIRSLRQRAYEAGAGAALSAGGEAANSWWRAQRNAMGYEGFADQFRKAVSAASKGERDRHLAGTLLAAGAMLHVLQDMGSPSHVRDDIAAHQEQIGAEESDRGSRFERIAALAFGRLGIPAATRAPALPGLAAHFTNSEGTGLADITERSYFSHGTLPRTTKVERNAGTSVFRRLVEAKLRRPEPKPPARLDVVAARNPKGATWTSEDGVCLSRYTWRHARVQFIVDDECALEQLEEILPRVSGYGRSFLETLFPGDLQLTSADQALSLRADADRYGAGTVLVFAETKEGDRKQYHSAPVPSGAAELSLPNPPKGTTRIAVLFDGVDVTGAPLLATTSSVWPLPK